MKPTIEGSNISKFDIRALSFEKGKERGIEVIEGAQKYSIFDDEIEIRAQKGELQNNDTLISLNGKLIVFPANSFNTLKDNRKRRKTKTIDREIR